MKKLLFLFTAFIILLPVSQSTAQKRKVIYNSKQTEYSSVLIYPKVLRNLTNEEIVQVMIEKAEEYRREGKKFLAKKDYVSWSFYPINILHINYTMQIYDNNLLPSSPVFLTSDSLSTTDYIKGYDMLAFIMQGDSELNCSNLEGRKLVAEYPYSDKRCIYGKMSKGNRLDIAILSEDSSKEIMDAHYGAWYRINTGNKEIGYRILRGLKNKFQRILDQ